MIYDGHAYCFPDLRGSAGFDDADQFRKHLQFGIARHFQPVWRSRDRQPRRQQWPGRPRGRLGLRFAQGCSVPRRRPRPVRMDGRRRGLRQTLHATLGHRHGLLGR